MQQPQRQPWPRRFTVLVLRIWEEIQMNASGVRKKITGLGDPSSDNDAAHKKYVDDTVASATQDLVSKENVDAGTTAALPANTRTADVLKADAVGAFPTIDGVAAALNNDYLVKNEGGGASHINNGIYTLTVVGDGSTEWELTRRADLDDGDNAAGAFVSVEAGTVNEDSTFRCINNFGSDVVNTDALEWKFWGETTDHANLKNVTIDQHHARDHELTHIKSGADEISNLKGLTGLTFAEQSNTYYVSDPKGNDTNDSAQFSQKKTIQSALDAGETSGVPEFTIIVESTFITESIIIPPDQIINIVQLGKNYNSFTIDVTFSAVSFSTTLSLMGFEITDVDDVLSSGVTLNMFGSRLSGVTNIGNTTFNFWGTEVDGATYATVKASAAGKSGFIFNGSRLISALDADSNKIINVLDGVGAQDGAAFGQIGSAITTHTGLPSAHHTKYTDAEAQDAVQYQVDVSPLAGVAPVDTDVSSWADGDRGLGVGTGGRQFAMVKRGTAVKYVELAGHDRLHSGEHIDGTDDIQTATAGQKGLMSLAAMSKLDSVATGADVTGDNPPQAHNQAASTITIATGSGSPTVDTIKEYIDNTCSSGYFIGGELSDGGAGTLDVAGGEGFIRATADPNAEILSFKWSASAGIAVTDDTTQYVFVDNAGAITLSTDEFLEAENKILLGVVTDEGGSIESVYNLGVRLEEALGQAGRFIRRVHSVTRDVRKGGLKFSDVGTRNIAMDAGTLWWGRTEYPITTIDTFVSGGFDIYSSAGQEASAATQWPNTQYDNSGTLTTMTNNRWANMWLFLEPDDHLVLVYGQDEFTSQALAEEEGPPTDTLPNRLTAGSILAARLTFQKSSDTPVFASAFDVTFIATGNPTTAHNLGGAFHNTDTLANLNSKISDATLIDINDSVNKALFDANTVLAADSDDTPTARTIAEQQIVGRITSGNIKGLTAAEIRTLINVADGADVTGSNAPQAHKDSHVDGSDDIRDATNALKGLATAAQITRVEQSAPDSLTFPGFPSGNGVLPIIGWNIQTDAAYALSNAAPLTISEPAFHSHIVIDASSVVGQPFDLTITGTSVDESTGVTTASDTEDISITGDANYQSTKSWIDAVVLSVPAGKTLTVGVFRTTYWDCTNKLFNINGVRLEWVPSEVTWGIILTINKVNTDGSITTIDTKTFLNTDTPPRAGGTGDPGKYKRGDYAQAIDGSNKEGLIITLQVTNIRSYMLKPVIL